MSFGFTIERRPSSALSMHEAADVRRLCDSAYGTPTEPFFESAGPGEHLLGYRGATLVSHLMWVTRWLQPGHSPPLRTAYIELVATDPAHQRRGYASTLLAAFPPLVTEYEVAALCPATETLYTRLGWRYWRGPLAHRIGEEVLSDPEERVMVLGLPRTPPLDWDDPLSVEWRPGEVW
jgi:aminoglycoside 2'-N-acetyltransferase I